MRICVVHLISFLILLIPLLLNTYFLLKNYQEHSELGETFSMSSTPRQRVLRSLVRKSISARSNEIESISVKLREVNNRLIKSSDTSLCKRKLCGDMCDTSQYVNYADEKLGAKVQNVKAEPIDQSHLSKMVGLEQSTNPPVNLLRSNMFPGNCYAFKNCEAEVEIQLAKEVFVDMIEIEHIPKCRSPTKDVSSAPRNFSVYGIHPRTGAKIHLGNFEFLNRSPCQTYKMPVSLKFRILSFKFETNHGNPDYTCVYRIAVYGHP